MLCSLIVLVQAGIFDKHFMVLLAPLKTKMKGEQIPEYTGVTLDFVRQVHNFSIAALHLERYLLLMHLVIFRKVLLLFPPRPVCTGQK